MKRKILLGVLLAFLLFGSLLGNMYLHELGHYTAAKYYNLKPEIHFFDSNEKGSKFSLYTSNVYTTYESPANLIEKKDAQIAFFGPLFNGLLAVFIGLAYFIIPKKRRTFELKLAFMVFLIPAVLSFALNILPIANTDGSIMLEFLKQLVK